MICHACQNSSLKQSYINNIFCDGCKAVWKNTILPKSSIDKSHNYAEKCAVCDVTCAIG